MIARFRDTDDPVLHTHLLRALAYQTDERAVQRNFELILDPSFPGHDAAELLRRLSQKADNRELVFDWMVANWDRLVERLPSSQVRWLPWRASAFCSLTDHARVEAFFAPRMQGHPGGLRSLEQVLEDIALCAAIADAQRPGAIEVLSRAD
jgi:hypothetical protein